MNTITADILWISISAALVMLMQAGFCLLECGLCRAKNSINVGVKNLVDLSIACVAFWMCGYGLMFGASAGGVIGTDGFFMSDIDGYQLAIFLFNLTFCATATTIISGAAAERLRFRSYVIITVIVSAFLYPVVGHWAWHGANVGEATGWLNSKGFIDFAGSTVVHSTGGWLALALVLVIGPRHGRFDTQGDLKGHNLTLAILGVLLLWFGWFGFNGGSTLAVSTEVPRILINTNLAAAFGSLSAMAISWRLDRRPSVLQIINGAIAGLVAITASCHIVQPTDAAIIGIVAGGVCIAATSLLERWKVDDVVGAFPAHAVAGVWGTLAVAIFGDLNAFGPGTDRITQFGIQLTGVAACFGWSFCAGYAIFWCINRFVTLRVTEEDENLGLNIAEHDASTDLIDLLSEMQSHRDDGEFSRQVAVEPHTEVGRIAKEYNLVLRRVNQEIGDRERAEQKWRSIFENATQGIFQSSPDGRLFSGNPSLCSILGYESFEELSEAVTDIGELYVDPDERKELLRRLRDSDVVTAFESRLRKRDGEFVWVSESIHACRNDDGEIAYFEGTIEDISERKSNERLYREKKEAEAASLAKSQFLASMSHEIRTPLNGVIGMLQLLVDSSLDERQRRYCDVARSSAEILLSVINEILDFSKIEAGKLDLETIEFDIHEILESTAEMFARGAHEKGLGLHCHIWSTVPQFILGDPQRLRQVIVNLMGNAIKFTSDGEVELSATIEASTDDSGEKQLRIHVRDTGIGIPADAVERLFDSFTQADRSTTRKFGGTGLGLAICNQLVELMDGTINVDSKPNFGTTFVVRLPLQQPDRRPAKLDASLGGTRVLVATDDPTNREILNEYLSAWDLAFTSVSSTAEIVETLKSASDASQAFEVAVFDSSFTEDVDQALRDQRLEAIQSALSVVRLTSIEESDEEVQTGFAEVSCVQKPLRQSRLFDAILASKFRRKPVAFTRVEEAAASTVTAPGNRTLLIVDDNEINRIVLTEMVQGPGSRILEATNGMEALTVLGNHTVDAVLLDCEMPVMDGYETARAIRAIEAEKGGLGPDGSAIPIIAVTAQAFTGDQERCVESGMDDYVSKPIDRGCLLNALARRLPEEQPLPSNQEELIDEPSAQGTDTTEATEEKHVPTAEVLDAEALMNRCGGRITTMSRVLNIFMERSPAVCDGLLQALDTNDFEEVRKLAHSLKGTSANIGAKQMAQTAAVLERAARGRDHTEISSHVVEIRSQLERCFEEINHHLDELKKEG